MSIRPIVLMLGFLTACRPILAQDACSADCPPLGIPAISQQPECWFCTKSQFTGDWCGSRSSMADCGVTVDADSTMFYMGVVDGGLQKEFRFAGHNDYVVNMDLGKAGLQEGLFVKLRAEHRYGDTLGQFTGTLLSPNVVADLPVPDSENVYLTNVLLTQMFSPNFGVFFGKLDTWDGDYNPFASGRGKTQFSNAAFVVNPATFRSFPYCTLGAGFLILSDQGVPILSFSVTNPTDTANRSGFSELFEEGVALASELRIPTDFFNLPGHHLFGGTWNNRDFVRLGQDPRIIFPQVPIQQNAGNWSLYWNGAQYFRVDECDPTKGWGVFARAGISDPETHLVEYFLSAGIGGNSILPGRQNDTFGVGWYRSYTSPEIGPILNFLVGDIGDGQGVEAFYNIAVTPWLRVTPDVQVLIPGRKAIDTTVVTGVRGQVIF